MTAPIDGGRESPLVFLSHASEDAKLAELVAQDLFGDALGLLDREVFCTSEVGSLKFGIDWQDQIREALLAAPLAFFLVTPNFVAKPFCIAELGAVWVQKKPAIALIAHGGDSKALPLMLKGLQAANLSDKDHLSELRRQYPEIRRHERDARWERKRDEFLVKLKATPSPFDVGASATPGASRMKNLADVLFGRRDSASSDASGAGSPKDPVRLDPNTGRVLAPNEPMPTKMADDPARSVAGVKPGSIGAQIMAAAAGPQPDYRAITPHVQALINAARERVIRLHPFTCKLIMTQTFRGQSFGPAQVLALGDTHGYSEALERGEVAVVQGAVLPREDRAHVRVALDALRSLQAYFNENEADRETYELAMNHAADLGTSSFWRAHFNVF